MRASRARAVAALLALAAVCRPFPGRRAFADDPKPPDKPSDAPKGDKPPETKEVPLQVLSDADAAPLLEGLRKAAKSRNGTEAMPALDAIGGKTHKDFEALLLKLVSHLSSDVGVRAAACVAERGNDKTPPRLWAAWGTAINKERYDVRSAILAGMGRLGARLDAKQYDEVAALWKAAPSDAALLGIAKYFEIVKTDKRPCRFLAEFLKEPIQSGNVNDGTNPPAAWWQAKWNQWKNVMPAAQDALKAITGQTFHDTPEAQTWFKSHEKDFGVVW